MRRWLKERLEALRQRLLEDEEYDDPRHIFGRVRPRNEPGVGTSGSATLGPPLSAAELKSDWGADIMSGSLLNDVFPTPLRIPSEQEISLLADTLWDVSWPVSQALEAASRAGRPGLMVHIGLSSCLHSERAARALKAAQELLRKEVALVCLEVGDRLSKRYIRQLRFGDTRLLLSSLPLTLIFDVRGDGMGLRTLALHPLGPSRGHKTLRALLNDKPQLAPGAEQEEVLFWQGKSPIVLNEENHFWSPLSIHFPGGKEPFAI